MTDAITAALSEYLAAYAEYKPALSRLTRAKARLRAVYLQAYRSGMPIDELSRRLQGTKWETRDDFARSAACYVEDHRSNFNKGDTP